MAIFNSYVKLPEGMVYGRYNYSYNKPLYSIEIVNIL